MDAQAMTSPNSSTASSSKQSYSFPKLYSEDAIKKAYKEGYRAGMQDSNQLIVSLDAQRQQVLIHNLEIQEKVAQARDQVDTLLRSVSLKSPEFAQLQNIWTLLNQACEMPKK
jgi:hypothetical protein